MSLPWRAEDWSRGILLGIEPDPNSGYRAAVWFEYTRYLFNEIREGSLIAVRNFSDRLRNRDGSPADSRDPMYEEYSVLQIDQVHPWHYAIQGGGERGYPGFTVAAAESARVDWTEMDDQNRDDVSRIKCEAIPLRLAFRYSSSDIDLPPTFFDRSMPMPGFEVRLLSSDMTDAILNAGVDQSTSFELGKHVVQFTVPIRIRRGELARLHFGVFGYTGAGKSNLVSTIVDNLLASGERRRSEGDQAFKAVVVDLADEYTGLLIDRLVKDPWSRLVCCGRRGLPELVMRACEAVAAEDAGARDLAKRAATDWASRLILPQQLKGEADKYTGPLMQLILGGKVRFYEPKNQQGKELNLDLGDLDKAIGPAAYGTGVNRGERVKDLLADVNPILDSARATEGEERDKFLNKLKDRVNQEYNDVVTAAAKGAIEKFVKQIETQLGTRGALGQDIIVTPDWLIRGLNFQPSEQQRFSPSLTLIIGENEDAIGIFVRQLIERCYESRRSNSVLFPTVSFIIDEADVFIAQLRQDSKKAAPSNLVEEVTLLARRGRKFGLGIGIATQRVRYLDTSIMAQPHTYFISKLPRKSDREVVAEAFAISDETLEQTFGFTVGQWLVTSHDATGLKGVPFPVQVPNANDRIQNWLDKQNRQ